MLTPVKQPVQALSKSRAIVCDDDPIMRSLIKARLTGLVDEVVDVADGLDAWRLLTTQTFHLAIFDLMMPGLDGFALIQCVRGDRRTRHLPIVVLSSNDDKVSINRALAEGASSYLTKPLMWSVFSDHIAHVMHVSYRAKQADTELTRYRQLSEAHAIFAATLTELSERPPETIIGELAKLTAAYSEIATYDRVNAQAHNLDVMLDVVRTAFLTRLPTRQVVIRGLGHIDVICNRPAIESVVMSLIEFADAAAPSSAHLEVVAQCVDDDLVVGVSMASANHLMAHEAIVQVSPTSRMYVMAHGGQIQRSADAMSYVFRLPRDRLADFADAGRTVVARTA